MSLALRFALSEIAVIVTLLLLTQTPLYPFLPFLAPLMLIPLISLPFRNPFSLPLYVVLLLLASSPLLSKSETFSAALDVLYYFGYEGVARSARDFFSMFPEIDVMPYILGITFLYASSSFLEGLEEVIRKLKEEGIECRGCRLSAVPAIAIAASLYFAVLLLRVPAASVKLDPFLVGLAAAFTAAVALILALSGVKSD